MTRSLRRGDIVLVPFPFTDLSATKYRPAVIVTPHPEGPDLLVAFVSSVIPDPPVPRQHILVREDHPEFRHTGLRTASVIRADKLLTISRHHARRRLGHLGPSLTEAMDAALRSALGL